MTDPPGDTPPTALSPRPKGRENAKDTACRNVTIYGHCRYEEKGCAFNHHDGGKANPSTAKATPIAADSAKKRFNVDSPSFTPASLAVNGNQPKPKATGISPKFANAAPFKPKVAGVGSRPASTAPSSTSSTKGYNPNAPEWTAPEAQEYLPPSYNNAIPPVSVDWFSFLLPLSIAIRVLPSILCRCEVESTVEHQDRGTPLIHLHGRPFCHARRPSFDEVLRQCSNTHRTFSFGGTAFFAIVTPTP